MLKNTFLLALFVLINHYFLKIDYATLHDHLVTFSVQKGAVALASGLAGTVLLIFCSYLFTPLGLYKLATLMGQVTLQVSQLGLLALALLNLAFWFILQEKLFATTNSLLPALFLLTLLGSAFSLRVIDFNFPIRHAILPSVVTVFVSGIAITTLSFFT